MTTQTTYSERQRKAFPGQTFGSDFEDVSRICETAAGIGFGLAVSQGSFDKGVVLGGASEDFVGISTKDITLVHALASLDKYVQYENMGVRRRGMVWVTAGSAVSNGDAVHFNATTGALSNAGGELLQGARWETSALSGEVALVYLSGYQNMAAS
jgi:hypothetical protein